MFDYPMFIEDTFKGIYYKDEENRLLDMVVTNIKTLHLTCFIEEVAILGSGRLREVLGIMELGTNLSKSILENSLTNTTPWSS